MRRCVRHIPFALFFIVVGCTSLPTPEPSPTPLPQSAWGSIYTVAYAPQLDAPAFALSSEQIAFAWVASDAAGVHQDVRYLSQNALSGAAALPLNPLAPRDLSVWPAAEGGSQLLYLDEDSATQTYRLYSAIFTAPHTLLRGPNRISDQVTARYTVHPDESGNFQVVWSTGGALESRLYAQQIDAFGRPQPASLLATDADYPVLVRGTDGQSTLFWLETNTDAVYRADFDGTELDATQPLGQGLMRQPGELLLSFNIAWTDSGSGLLLIWNTLLPNGTPQVYSSVASLESGTVTTPTLLSVNRAGLSQPLSWLTIAASNADLWAAAAVGDELGILGWDGETFANFQPVVTLKSPLIGLPQLKIDADKQLYLAWAEPHSETAAELRFTMTSALDTLGN